MLCVVSVFFGVVYSVDLLDKIKVDKMIIIVIEVCYVFFELVENGKIVGYDVDLMNYILQKSLLGVEVK